MSYLNLTGLDWQLLQLLQENGRMTVSEISTRLGRSRSNVSEHLKKLLDSGVLSAISTRLNEEKLGFGLSAFVRLKATSFRHREIVNAVVEMPEVAECHVLTGSELLIIRIVARDMPHLRDLVDGLTQYGSTHTDVIFSTVKDGLKVNHSLRKTLA